MSFGSAVRRTVSFVVTVVLMLLVGYQLAWHKDEWLGVLTENPLGSIVFLILLLGTGALIVWAVVKPSSLKTILAFGLGIVCALFGRSILEGISWSTLAWLALVLVGLVVLWAATTWVGLPAWVPFFGRSNASGTGTPAPAPAPAPAP